MTWRFFVKVGDLVTSFVEKLDEEEFLWRDKPVTGILVKKQHEGGDGILCSVLAENEIKLFLDSEIVDTPLTLRQLDAVRGGMSPGVFDLWRSELINEDR
jgi:hypothetical protein